MIFLQFPHWSTIFAVFGHISKNVLRFSLARSLRTPRAAGTLPEIARAPPRGPEAAPNANSEDPTRAKIRQKYAKIGKL